jgi:serine/threonine-protein kinase RsbW
MAQGATQRMPDERSAVRAKLRLVVDRPAQLASFRRELRALLVERGLREGEREAIVLAAVEALSNALQVCEDANCRIEVLVSLVGDYVCIEVRDAAQGFKGVCLDLVDVPEACEEHGRGLYLMRTLMESLEVVPRPRGTLVRMVKRLEVEGRRGQSDDVAC